MALVRRDEDAIGKRHLLHRDTETGAVEIEKIGVRPEEVILGKAARCIFGRMVVGDIEAVRRDRRHIIRADEKSAAYAGTRAELGCPIVIGETESLHRLSAIPAMVDRQKRFLSLVAPVKADAVGVEILRNSVQLDGRSSGIAEL